MQASGQEQPWWTLHTEAVEIERRRLAAFSSLHPTAPRLPPLATRLVDCLPLVRRIAAQLKQGERGRRNWPVAGGPGLFAVSVAPHSQLRALCTLDRMLRHCEASGLELVAREAMDCPAHFLVQAQRLTFRLSESADREHLPPTPATRARALSDPSLHRWKRDQYHYRATGVLRLLVTPVGSPWVALTMLDSTDASLAERIAELPMKLQQVALRLRLRDEVREEISRGLAGDTQSRANRERLKAQALEKLAAFETAALQFERARRLRALADAVESKGVSTAASDVVWMRQAADWLDPAVRRPWDLLGDPQETSLRGWRTQES